MTFDVIFNIYQDIKLIFGVISIFSYAITINLGIRCAALSELLVFNNMQLSLINYSSW